MPGPLAELANQIRKSKGSLGNALANMGQQYGVNASPGQMLADVQAGSPLARVPTDVQSRYRHRGEAIKKYEKEHAFNLADPGSWLSSIRKLLPGEDAEDKDIARMRSQQAKVLKSFPELASLHKQISDEQNQTKMAQLGTLESVKKQFGSGIKAPGEASRRAATSDEDKAIVTFISQRKAQLLAQPPYGPNYGPDTATAQAIAEARVLFPQVSTASILASFGKPGMEPIPAEAYKVWIGPDRAAALSTNKLNKLLDQQFDANSDFARTLDAANKYAATNQQAGASLSGFLSHLSRSTLSKTNPETGRNFTTNEVASLFAKTAQVISVVAALKGFY